MQLVGTYREVYFSLVKTVYEEGEEESPRGQKVVSYPSPIMCTLVDPWNCFLDIPGRKFNYKFAAAEVFWILSGNGAVSAITPFNKQMSEYSNQENDDSFKSPWFHGSYGRRIRRWGEPEPYGLGYPIIVDQLALVIDRLKKDLQTRQAVISLFDPIKDYVIPNRRDYPCNNVVYFRVQGEQVHISVVRRSNDLIWGFPYNVIQFAAIQMVVANSLDLKPGSMTIFIQNAHIYKQPRKYVAETNKVLQASHEVKQVNLDSCLTGDCVKLDSFPLTDSFVTLKILIQQIAQLASGEKISWFPLLARLALAGKPTLEAYWV